MMKAVTAKEFDMVASWSVDRLGRSLTDHLSILQGLHEKGVGLFLHQPRALAERAQGGRGSRGLRTDLSRSGDADRAVVRHDVGGPGHEYAGGAEEQQQS